MLLLGEFQCGRFRRQGEIFETGMKHYKFTVVSSTSLIFNDNDAAKVAF